MDAIEKVEKGELAWNGRKVRISDEEIITILTPMFALYANATITDATIDAYVMMLRDFTYQSLYDAVKLAMNNCKFLPTVADIREQHASRAPGPRSEVDPRDLPDIPTKMFRLSDAEDREARLERLRLTKNWDKYYS